MSFHFQLFGSLLDPVTLTYKTRPGGALAKKVDFGKHFGSTIEEVLLRAPNYVMWALELPDPSGGLASFRHHFKEAIGQFDSLPFLQPCRFGGCKRRATQCEVWRSAWSPDPIPWCDTCMPMQIQYPSDKTLMIRTFFSAVSYVRLFKGGREEEITKILRFMEKDHNSG